jgi:ABC-2 type transport system ATP-binding protein
LMIGDERSFYWRLSGRRNLGFFAALHGLRAQEADERIQQVLEIVELTDAADRPVLGYSSGMRARLSLARALLSSPPLLLLDEPTTSLDPLAASRFRDLASRLARERDVGVLFATHDLNEAVAIADRVVMLVAGRVAHDDTTAGMEASELEAIFRAAVEGAAGTASTVSVR